MLFYINNAYLVSLIYHAYHFFFLIVTSLSQILLLGSTALFLNYI